MRSATQRSTPSPSNRWTCRGILRWPGWRWRWASARRSAAAASTWPSPPLPEPFDPHFPMTDARTYQDWVAVHTTSTDFEADLIRDRLDEAGVDAVVLTQRDHAFNLNVGDLAPVYVMVKPEDVERAREVIR